MIRTIIFKLLLAILFVIWSPILLFSLISKKLTNFIVNAEVYNILFLARIIVGIKYKIHYPALEENGIPFRKNENCRLDGKAIIAAKHMSILEVAILKLHIPNSFFILKRELTWIPIYGWAFLRIGNIPVNRSKGKTNMKKLVDIVEKKVLDKKILIIFPEGTRTKVGQKVKLKPGFLFIAKKLKLPIQPVGTDSGVYWPKKGWMKSGISNIYFEPIVPSNASLEEVAIAISKHSA